MAQKIDIHHVDEDTGYSVAEHILTALENAGDDGMTSTELGALLQVSGARVGSWLRDLRCRGWTAKTPVSPGSYIVRWHLTGTGWDHLHGENSYVRPVV